MNWDPTATVQRDFRGAADGAYVNHPDADLADGTWNTSGVPWSELYCEDAHPRLRAVKVRPCPPMSR
ncbi:hypothetical protein ACF1A5_26280 [Streptomyces sp. NPDC014864]|uniref:hypothetical protein n=1 Tax=Streptomyces sp. NPDC014864 TaxID=3364924 RepID=UPI0037036618